MKRLFTLLALAAGLHAQVVEIDVDDTNVTKSSIGLADVDNTADLAKPVSTAQAAAIAAAQAHAVQRGNHTGTQTAATISDFATAAAAAAPVQTVAGKSGAVTLNKADVGLSSVDNTADSAKPVSTLQAAADAAVQAFAIQRTNHTGTQLAATISDFESTALALMTWANVSGKPALEVPLTFTGGLSRATNTITLANTAVTPGSYTAANITIGADGRITAAANGDPGDPTALTAGTAAAGADRVWVSGGADRTSVATPVTIDPTTGAMSVPSVAADALDADSLLFVEAAAPSTPASGRVTLYAKTDGLLYSKNDAGTETLVSGGAGGGGSGGQWETGDLRTIPDAFDVPSGWSLTGVNGIPAYTSPDADYKGIVLLGGTVATPTFSPVAGEVDSGTEITISTTTPGASIRYTTDGNDPTRSTGTVYSGPVAITDPTTFEAIAYLDYWADSSIATAAYTITPSITYLVNQRFEGAGYDNSETWTTSSGTPDPDYTTTVLEGAQSLFLGTATGGHRVRHDFTNQGSFSWYFLLRLVGSAPPGTRTVAALSPNGSGTYEYQIDLTTSSRLQLFGGLASPANSLSYGTTYHVWVDGAKGTSGNAVVSIAFSTDGVKPTSGGNYAITTAGPQTNDVGRMWFGHTQSGNYDIIVDKSLLAAGSGTIGSNPL